jgi:hypothetical protein
MLGVVTGQGNLAHLVGGAFAGAFHHLESLYCRWEDRGV